MFYILDVDDFAIAGVGGAHGDEGLFVVGEEYFFVVGF